MIAIGWLAWAGCSGSPSTEAPDPVSVEAPPATEAPSPAAVEGPAPVAGAAVESVAPAVVAAPVAVAPVAVAPAVAPVAVAREAVGNDELARVEAPVVPEPPATAPPTTYSLVPGDNDLLVIVKYERGTMGASLAHDHAVVATRFSGSVTWDPSGACSVSVDVPATGLRVDPPGARALAGLDGDAPPEDRPKIEENLRGSRQLDADAFPVLTFRATRCAARADARYDVTGVLTIHGVARPTSVVMAIEADGTELRASGTLKTTHADFGLKPFSAAMGAVRNAEPLTFLLDLRAVAAR